MLVEITESTMHRMLQAMHEGAEGYNTTAFISNAVESYVRNIGKQHILISIEEE